MNTFALMRRIRLKTFARTFTRGRGMQRFRYIYGVIFGGFVFLAAFGLSLLGFRALLRFEGGESLVALVPAVAYNIAAFALIFVGLASALYTIYLSRDLDVLFSMPVKERTVFAYKFWETLLGNSVLFVALALPVLLACGVAARASVLFYPTVLVVSVLVLIIPTGLCVLLIMPLMRLIPANKAKEIVGALGALAGVAFYVGQLWLTRGSAGSSRISSLGALSESPILSIPPGSWASDTLAGAAFLEWGRLFAGLVPLAALSVAIYAICLSLVGWAYKTGRARAAESGGRARSFRSAGRLFGWLPRDVRAVVIKDLTVLPRDLRRLTLMVWPAAMLIALLVINYPRAANAGFGGRLLPLIPYLAASVFAFLVSSQIAGQVLNIEGRSYWFLAASPLSPGRILTGKWISSLSLGTVAALLGSGAVSIFFGFYLPGFLSGVALGIVGSAIVSLYSIGISALFPRFDWENPKQVTSTTGGFLILACLIGFAILAALAWALASFMSGFVPFWASVTGAAVLWVVCAAIPGYAVFSAGAERLKRLDWEL